MRKATIKTVVRTLFIVTTRAKVPNQIHAILHNYMRLAGQVDRTTGKERVMVPRMRGIDEDMRNWSFFMILEHNKIVNRSITSIVQQLSRNEEPAGEALIDPKKEVMPSANPGVDQIDLFRQSIEEHLECVSNLGPLRGTRTKDHPIFGPFDAHKWNCMFAFHLGIHYRQAEHVVSTVCHHHAGS